MAVTKQHKGQWRSIEFECWFISAEAKKEFQAFVKKKKYGKKVSIGNDGSIEPSPPKKEDACGNCYECKSGYWRYCIKGGSRNLTAEIQVSYVVGKEKIVREICAFLKTRAMVNDTCGTHVHFDMRHLDEAEVRVIGVKLACAVPALRKLLPRSRRTSDYCHMDICDVESWDDKESFVNVAAYAKYKTIEVRGHSGTLDADKILNWIALCDKIMYSDVIKSIKEPKHIKKYHGTNKELSSYITKRAKDVNKRAFIET